jgi:phosphatidylglycerophosphate synthase
MSPSKVRLRRVFSGLVLRIARPIANRGVNPDAISYLTLLFAIFALVVLVVFQNHGVDGAVARLSDASSAHGAFTDSVVDKVSEVLVLLAILVTYPTETVLGIPLSFWLFICISSWLMTSYLRSRAESLGVKDLDIGLGARSERLFILVIFSISSYLFEGVVVVTLVGLATAAYRFHHYSKEMMSSTL